MQMSACREFSFEMAHVLAAAQTVACVRSIHGHSYQCRMEVYGDVMPASGMVLDFGVLKQLTGAIKGMFDHRLWVPSDCMKQYLDEVQCEPAIYFEGVPPTAEVMAVVFAGAALGALGRYADWAREIHMAEVPRIAGVCARVGETRDSFAKCVRYGSGSLPVVFPHVVPMQTELEERMWNAVKEGVK